MKLAMRFIALFVLILTSGLVLADGKFFGPVAADPKTPFQRGLVAFDGKVETLIVESMIHAPTGDYVWVIPVPSKPISIERATPGTLATAVQLLTPRVERPPTAWFLIGFLVWSAVVFSAYRALARGTTASRFLSEVVLLLLGLSAAYLFFFPVFAGAVPGSQVRSEELGRIGSYDVSEVGGKDAGAIVADLEKRGAALDERARQVVESYVAEGWTFVVAKLSKGESGASAPHPLKIRFETQTPLYPMRLTGVGSGGLALQLVVIGDQTAQVEGLEVWRSTHNQVLPARGTMAGLEGPGRQHRPVNHPEIASLLSPESVLTYLHGSLEPDELAKDFHISWTGVDEVSKRLDTSAGLMWLVLNRAVFAWSAIIFGVVAAGLYLRKSRAWIVGGAFGIGLLGAILIGLTARPGATVVETRTQHRLAERGRIRSLMNGVRNMRWDGVGELRPKAFEALDPWFDEDDPKWQLDVPGGVWIEDRGKNRSITVFDENGTPWTRRF